MAVTSITSMILKASVLLATTAVRPVALTRSISGWRTSRTVPSASLRRKGLNGRAWFISRSCSPVISDLHTTMIPVGQLVGQQESSSLFNERQDAPKALRAGLAHELED